MGIKSTTAICCIGLLLIFLHPGQAQNWEAKVVADNLVGAFIRGADFDGDQDSDLLIQDGDTLFWYENHQSGWIIHIIDSLFLGSETAWVNVFDMDGDGDPDILQAASNPTGTIDWNENRQNGSEWVKHGISSNIINPANMQGTDGDIDNDNDIDLIVPSFQNGSVFWFENAAGDTVWHQHEIAKFNNIIWSSVADIDGDRDLDIAVGDFFSGDIHWIENQLPDNTWPVHPIATLSGSAIGECFDIDDDGDPDVVTHSNLSNFLVYFENPSWNVITILSGVNNLNLGVIGDIDCDLDADVTYGGLSEIGWVENLGGSWIKHEIGSGEFALPTGIADINLDGKQDILAYSLDFSTNLGDARWYANPTPTAIDDIPENNLSSEFRLFQNYPNPFNPATIISYQLPKPSKVALEIYSLSGQKVKSLVNQAQSAGIKEVMWNGSNDLGEKVPSGIYFYRLTAGSFTETRKIIYLR